MVYANDTVGNMGATENVNFTIERPEVFPVAPVAAVSGCSLSLGGCWFVGLPQTHSQNSLVNKVGLSSFLS